MKIKPIIWSLFIVVSFAMTAETKIYKVVKADGTVVYTDTPPPGATEFKMTQQPNLITANPLPKNNAAAPGSTAPKVNTTYQVKITAPEHEATVRNNAGEVTITASLEPDAKGTFVLYINGQEQARNTAPRFEMSDLNRGMYQIKINFFDQSGKLLASSEESVFYLHQASALIRAN